MRASSGATTFVLGSDDVSSQLLAETKRNQDA